MGETSSAQVSRIVVWIAEPKGSSVVNGDMGTAQL